MINLDYDPQKLENQLCFPLYAASKEVIRRYRPYLKPYGITYTQYLVMLCLWDRDNVNIKSLGKRLYLDSGTLTPLLKKLVHLKYIERESNERDERNVIIRCSEKGLVLRDKCSNIPLHLADSFVLDKEDSIKLYYLLKKVILGYKNKQ